MTQYESLLSHFPPSPIVRFPEENDRVDTRPRKRPRATRAREEVARRVRHGADVSAEEGVDGWR